jgi:enamine deaminase RidA (YjgF/YER057c/UK114 family)
MEITAVDPWDWQRQFSYSQSLRVADIQRIVWVAGQPSVDSAGDPIHPGDMRAQLSQAFDNLETVLRSADVGFTNLVRLDYYTTDVDALFGAWNVVTERLSSLQAPPTSTLLGVSRLAYPDLLVEIGATAVA